VTSDEFNAREAELLQALPNEFHSAVSYHAYESGHAYGHEEVLIHLQGMVDMLAPCINKYTQRLQNT
jgi:hypothetical protein